MPVAITIRAVPDEVRDTLAARAATSHMSLQEYLCSQLVAMAARPDVAQALADARRRASHYPFLDPDQLFEDLDADRR